jgi:Negative regulator of beta-lactamase expression
MRYIDTIFLHCSATQPNWLDYAGLSDQVAAIRSWHVARGWRDIGYHYLVGRLGTVAEGRPVEEIGAHVRGHNRGSIGICLIGGHGSSADDRFDEHFTPMQRAATEKLIRDLHKRFGPLRLRGHNEVAAKACPGFRVDKEFGHLMEGA